MKGTTTDEISSSAITSGISVKNDEWSDYSASYTVEDGVITDNVTIRFDLENLSADDLFYLDDFKITYNTSEYIKKEVPYISYEDFEGNDIVLL